MPRCRFITWNSLAGRRGSRDSHSVVLCRDDARGLARLPQARPSPIAHGLVQSRLVVGWGLGCGGPSCPCHLEITNEVMILVGALLRKNRPFPSKVAASALSVL